MSNYNRSSKGSKAATITAAVLGLLLAASITLSLGHYFGGWFEKTDEIEDTDTVQTEDTDSSTQSSSESDAYELEAE